MMVTECLAPAAASCSPQRSKTFAGGEWMARCRTRRLEEGRALCPSREAADRADILRAAYQKRHKAGCRSEEADNDFKAVAQAYLRVIRDYPGAEAAIRCRRRLAGIYGYRGEKDQSGLLLGNVVVQSTSPSEMANAAFALGLHHMHTLSDPVSALAWFASIPLPGDRRDDSAKASGVSILRYYFAAQWQMIKCELTLNQPGKARARYDRLVRQQGDEQSARELLRGVLREAGMNEDEFLAVEPEAIAPPAFCPAKTGACRA